MDNDKIEQLKKSLYSRNAPSVRHKKARFSKEEDSGVKRDWEHKEELFEEQRLNSQYKDQGSSFLKKILIGSVIFFVIALALGSFVLLRGENVVSANNVDITVGAPASIAGGDTLSMDVKVHNKNGVKLEVVDLSVEFPEGTADPEDTSKELRRYRQLMEDINPGATASKTVKAVLYGEENSKKEIKITVEYRVQNSNATYFKDKIYEIHINTAPVTLDVSTFKELNSGQEFDLTTTITSNSKDVLKKVLLKAEYPFGFTFISSDPKIAFDNNVWKIGDLLPGSKRVIKIHGKIDGQDDEERIFNFMIGSQSTKNEKIIGTQYVSSLQALHISKPFLAVGLTFNGEKNGFVARPKNVIGVDLDWVNNLSTNISDAEIKVSLSGSAYDRNSVDVTGGYFRSSDNSVIWNRTTNPELVQIDPGATGHLRFTLTPRVSGQTVNPTLGFDVSVKGTRLSEDNVPGQITSTVKQIVKVSPDIDISTQLVRSTGPFTNIGPIPPRADSLSTYTVIWTVSNTSSTIVNAEARAKLPAYVKWMDKISPSGEDITYNSVTSELVWKIGDLKPYTGSGATQRQAQFQIGFQPSISHVGQSPTVVGEITLKGQDQYSGVTLTDTESAVGPRFSTDPVFKNGDEIVVK